MTGWLNELKNKIHLYAAYKRLTSNRHIQTGSEGMEKYIPCKYKWQQYLYQKKNTKI